MTDKRAIDPTEISWSDELGDTPFFHTTYLDLNENSNKVIASQSNRRPIGWILEQLTGRVDVVCLSTATLLLQHTLIFSLGISHRLLPR
jgi:hypothetical protein